MIDFSTPLAGMHNAESRLDVTASRIARGPFQASQQPADTVDLSTDMVNLMQERNDFETNIKVAQTEDEMLQSTLSLMG